MLIYQKGDLFKHLRPDDVIAHCCNDVGAFGGGFTRPLDDRFHVAKNFYAWAEGKLPNAPPYELGQVQLVLVYDSVDDPDYVIPCSYYVANMVGQHGVRSEQNPVPVDYEALKKAMSRLIEIFSARKEFLRRIVAPKFGAGLAGGDWNIIVGLINEVWADFLVVVFEL
jgi:O-acetyl-ADP-ribose deacetylase (regulator of RNase III)